MMRMRGPVRLWGAFPLPPSPPLTHSRRSLGRPWKVSEVRQPIRLLERSLERHTQPQQVGHVVAHGSACEGHTRVGGACGRERRKTRCWGMKCLPPQPVACGEERQ